MGAKNVPNSCAGRNNIAYYRYRFSATQNEVIPYKTSSYQCCFLANGIIAIHSGQPGSCPTRKPGDIHGR